MTDLPGGTVTFLFTDVEGSTRLLHELGEGYAAVLAEHRRVLRDAFARHGGVEVDTQGDAFFVAFAKATDALAAAAEGRDALADGPIRVRMGLHTGEPTLTREGYVGIDVHRAARIASAGHGGQILVSQATRDLVADELRDLGEHRLKDLADPERIYQLGDGVFPPLKSLNNSNLPVPAEPLVGRKKELAEVLRLLRDGVRLVTVTGPGGSGKTRFALEAAAELVNDFRDGVWWIGLAPVRDEMLVKQTIAAAVGVKDLHAELRGKELLLLLDNFEHVIDAAVGVAELQSACPRVVALVTSREPLHIAGEREYPLAPLAESPAAELFRQRAVAVAPDFDADYDTLVGVCDRLDRLPLAIELAAARMKTLGLDELLPRLEQRLPLLTSRRRDVEERQRTLRATIEWSYELLSADDRSSFVRLSIFAGSFHAQAAEAVCGADLDALESLVDKSLVRPTDEERFFMLETIREFALGLLEPRPEHRAVRRRHAEYELGLVEGLLEQSGKAARDRIGSDYANLRQALIWFRDDGDGADLLRLASRLARFWDYGGYLDEGREWLEAALERTPPSASLERVRALTTLSHMAWRQGDLVRASQMLDEAELLAPELADPDITADIYGFRGGLELSLGHRESARAMYLQAIDLYNASGNERARAVMVHDLGYVALESGDLTGARRYFEESLAICRKAGLGEGGVLSSLGNVEFQEGNLEVAHRLLREGIRQELKADSLTLSTAHDLHVLAAVEAGRGNVVIAAKLLGAAEAYYSAVGAAGEPLTSSARVDAIAGISSHVGDDEAERLLDEGRALDFRAAAELAADLD